MKYLLLFLLFTFMYSCSDEGESSRNEATQKVLDKETPQWWFEQGQKKIQELESQSFPKKAKNVILVVGDGMSVGTITAARILAGQKIGGPGEEHQLSFEKFPQTALSKTYTTNYQTPDSAGTMSAMVTGIKTKSGVVSMNGNVLNGDCESGFGNEQMTILEQAEIAGMSTAIISTAKITHATPAATYSHSVSRGWESDSEIPLEERVEGCVDIAKQLIDFPHGDGLEIALGGGRSKFLPDDEQDPEYDDIPGKREDGENLLKEWEDKFNDAKAIWNLSQFDEIDVKKTKHLLGVFQPSHMQYEQDRENDIAGEPSLTQMTEKSIQILQHINKPYFLMIEAGRIDHGHHGGNGHRALIDTIELSRAVKKAVEMANLDETLIIVTADHAHTMSLSGYPERGNPILGLVKHTDERGNLAGVLATDDQGKPYTTLSYANGPGYVNGDERPDLTHVDVESPDYKQAATLPAYSETHSAEDVAIYATGAGSHLVRGTLEQNVIYHIMHAAIKDNLISEQ